MLVYIHNIPTIIIRADNVKSSMESVVVLIKLKLQNAVLGKLDGYSHKCNMISSFFLIRKTPKEMHKTYTLAKPRRLD